jgi:hypothetical protein
VGTVEGEATCRMAGWFVWRLRMARLSPLQIACEAR